MPICTLAAASARPGSVSSLPLGAAGAHEHRIESAAAQKLAHAADRMVELEVNPHPEDLSHLIVKHGLGETEGGYVGAHEAAGLCGLLEYSHFIPKRQKIIGHGQGSAPGADQRHALAILQLRNLGQPPRDVISVVSGDPLQTADGDRLVFHPSASARRLAGPITHTSQDAGKHI